MPVSNPQPIGFAKKKSVEKNTEQISFKMIGRDADTKRRFLELLRQRGLNMKEVLVEFIERYVEYEGNLGVVELSDAFPQDGNKLVKFQSENTIELPRSKWHNRLNRILEHASPEIGELLVDNFENLVELAFQEQQDLTNGISPKVEAALNRARDAILHARRSGGVGKRDKPAHPRKLRKSG
jgi:hypothetical protein